jgi:hypothetical protein
MRIAILVEGGMILSARCDTEPLPDIEIVDADLLDSRSGRAEKRWQAIEHELPHEIPV